VVGPVEGEHPRLAGRHRHRLERRLHRLRPGVRQHRARSPPGATSASLRSSSTLTAGGCTSPIPCSSRPPARGWPPRCAGARAPPRDRERGGQVHVHVAVHVPHVRPAASVPEDREVVGQVGDVRRLVLRQLPRQPPRLGPRRRRDGGGGGVRGWMVGPREWSSVVGRRSWRRSSSSVRQAQDRRPTTALIRTPPPAGRTAPRSGRPGRRARRGCPPPGPRRPPGPGCGRPCGRWRSGAR
jgi:hypothetical protein